MVVADDMSGWPSSQMKRWIKQDGNLIADENAEANQLQIQRRKK
jgi:hypothetical protein